MTNGYVKDVTDIDFRDYIVNESRNSNQPFDPKLVVTALQDLKGEKVSNYALKIRGIISLKTMPEIGAFPDLHSQQAQLTVI